AEQGYALGDFDLVVAAGALHLATDLRAALGRIFALLAPGGLLLVREPHRAERELCVAGMLEEFWSCADDELRPHSPLLEAHQWPPVLAEAGFTQIVQPDLEPAFCDFSVMLATAAGAPATTTDQPQPATAAEQATAEQHAVERAAAEQATADEDVAEQIGVWVIAGEEGSAELTDALQTLMREGGGEVTQTRLHDDADRWYDLIPAGTEAFTLAIVLGGPETGDGADPDADTVVEQITRRAAALGAFAAACQRLPEPPRLSLWLVARPCGALSEPGADATAMHPEDAATWGTTRTLANEHPHIKVRRVCLHPSGDAVHDARRLAAEFLDAGDEDELLLTRQGRFVPRLVEAGEHTVRTPIGPATAFELRIPEPGLSFIPAWRQTTPPVPGPDQVTIDVRAVGLNFRDLMFAVNLLPSQAIENVIGGHELGMEAAGIITATGSDVTGFRPGDRVMTFAPTGVTTHAVADARFVAGMPDEMTFTEAATVPMTFATVMHSLGTCAQLKAGETVLVHGGAGGVGLAALRFARARGA
ncbi:alcohol dehydrogenase catalytic domain-containing protein, partial [Actinomadura fulvescens]